MRKDLWNKLEKNERNFKWFHKNYLQDSGLHYNTLYQQAKGEILTTMCVELVTAIAKYVNGGDDKK